MVVQQFDHLLRNVMIIFFMELQKLKRMKLNIIVEVVIVHINLKQKEKKNKVSLEILMIETTVSETLLETTAPHTKLAHPRRSSLISWTLLN